MEIELSHTPLFIGIDKIEIRRLLNCLNAQKKSFQKNEIIWSEGSRINHIGIIMYGKILIEHSDIWGNNTILSSASTGAVFGESYACTSAKELMISVKAAENTDILFLDLPKLMNSCSNNCMAHTLLIQNLLSICAEKSIELTRKIFHTEPKSVRARLLSYFSECSKKANQLSFDISYNRQQLADYLGVERSVLCHELSKMQQDGLIDYHKNHFDLKNSKKER